MEQVLVFILGEEGGLSINKNRFPLTAESKIRQSQLAKLLQHSCNMAGYLCKLSAIWQDIFANCLQYDRIPCKLSAI